MRISEQRHLRGFKITEQHRQLESPTAIACVSLGDDPLQCPGVSRRQRPGNLLILVNDVVDLGSNEKSSLQQDGCDKARAGPQQAGDNKLSPSAGGLLAGQADNEALVQQ